MLFLPVAFFLTALLYATIGFAGGSTYTALLALFDTDYRIIPIVSLMCNVLVSAGGTWRFARAGHLDARKLSPWLALSIPCAFLGGRLSVEETLFYGMLGIALLVAGGKLLWPDNISIRKSTYKNTGLKTAFIGGGILGFLAGITGIGGGIYLAPVLYFLRWGNAKKIAAACSFFILINSLAGIVGQFYKQQGVDFLVSLQDYVVLLPVVIFGGAIGSWLGASRLPQKWIKKGTGLLIIYVSVQLLRRFIDLI